ncbi:hypothetical protein DWB61_00920 [Ancylomarina euxinus]|uniref:Signal transduction histidine kinase internal region domain-containing protein n=1 Tax=Ancylomarina euxinus TaxID=2283627 RepID=A0A425Y7Y4_9BACT|nr:histidine kinase [Ancylomarina euxinus]MCZ4693525.1 histidine kinase [Ancylomarina euxinus]MUP13752.1 hypothetical protein [Ancylomarina euxinus]RRG24610.1 hypothetical protein DWB61_00920 [Ancylomarina euxinus]
MLKRLAQKSIQFLSSPWGISLFLAIPLWWLTIDHTSQYEIKKMDEGMLSKNRMNFWIDLDSDGITERLHVYPFKKDFYSIPIHRVNNDICVQYNIRGSLAYTPKNSISFGDFDINGFKEIYTISNCGDSLFLNVIEPLGKGEIIKERFMGLTRNGKAGYDYEIKDSQLYDVDGDGKKEFVTLISGGFNLYPRHMYIYDIEKDKLKKSDYLASKIYGFNISDINDDGHPEFLITNSAAGNMRPPLPTPNDYNAYLYILDQNLKPLIKPKIFEGETQQLEMSPISIENRNYWLAFSSCSSKLNAVGYNFYLYNYKGEVLKNKHFPFNNPKSYLRLRQFKLNNKPECLVLKSDGTINKFDRELNLKQISKIDEKISTYFQSIDLDQNGKDETLTISNNGQELYVYRNGFKRHETYDIDCIPGKYYASIILGKYNHPAFYLQVGNQWFEFIYRKISYYYLRVFGIISGIYTGLFVLVWGIQFLTTSRDRRKKRLAELQLTNWKNQLDPHFTFNTLNSVGAVILSEDRDKAYDFFTRFSKLVRYALEASNKVSVSIEDEIHFIELYLQLEQFRFNDKFNYTIDVSKEVNRFTQVPKMLLQTYVENAVRHGLMDRNTMGLLKINIFKEKGYLIFQVKDNGIGRVASNRKRRLSNGIGMKAMKEYFELLNSINYKNISLEIKDSDETNIKFPGTIVTIRIPKDFSYEL